MTTPDASACSSSWVRSTSSSRARGPATSHAFGLSRDEVREQFPSLVVATISGFGTTGPYADYTWSDLVAQTAAWVTFPQGRSVDIPVRSPRVAALCSVGHTAALGALSGVLRARASGTGAHVDCSAFEALGSIPARVCRYLGWEYADHVPLLLAANAADTLLPTGVFPCADGYVSMMSTPQQLREMLEVLDDDALKEAFARPDAFSNPETKEILDTALYPWLFEHTRAEATALAQAAQWPLAGVYSPAEVMQADHFYQRGFWVDCDDPVLGQVLLPGAPYRHAEGGWQLHHPAPAPPAPDVARRDAPPRPSAGSDARRPTSHRCAASGSSTSRPCGRAPTSRSCSPTSAPR